METFDIYIAGAKHFSITIEELRHRLTQGEALIQKYYEEHYGWNAEDDTAIFF